MNPADNIGKMLFKTRPDDESIICFIALALAQ